MLGKSLPPFRDAGWSGLQLPSNLQVGLSLIEQGRGADPSAVGESGYERTSVGRAREGYLAPVKETTACWLMAHYHRIRLFVQVGLGTARNGGFLGVENLLGLEGVSFAVGGFGDVEEDSVGVELWGAISFDWS
jgi:hypothetical protein